MASQMAQILDEARHFLTESLRGKENGRETLHPWRKGWEFTVGHSLRVEAMTVQILSLQMPPFPQNEIVLLRLAAILHDVARLDGDVSNHAQRGAELVAEWLDGHPSEVDSPVRIGPRQIREAIRKGVLDRGQLLSLIAHHSDKDIPGPDLANAILKDADTLDEIGAVSILMCTNWFDRSDPAFLANLLERLRSVEIPFCRRTLSQLNTSAAKSILRQRQEFVEGFISQLGNELSGIREV